MLAELKTIYDSTEALKAEIVASIAAKTEKTRNRPVRGSSGWSMLQILEHLTIVNGLTNVYLIAPPIPFPRGGPMATPTKFSLLLEIGVLMMKTGIPIGTPKNMEPSDAPKSLLELGDVWDEQQAILKARLEKVEENQLRFPIARHPQLGPINGLQLLRLYESHLIYHRRQVLSVVELK